MRPLQLRHGAPLVRHVDIGIEVGAAFNGNAADLQNAARELVALRGDRHRAQQRLQPLADNLVDPVRSVVTALGSIAHERLELGRLAHEEWIRKIEQRAVQPIARNEAQLAVDQRQAAGEVVDRRLQCLRLLADSGDIGADGDEAFDLAGVIEARNDDGFEADVGAVLGAVAELASPRFSRMNGLPHLGERLAGLAPGTEHLIGFADELGLCIADHLAKAIVHLQQSSAGVGDGDAEVLFERPPVAVETIGGLTRRGVRCSRHKAGGAPAGASRRPGLAAVRRARLPDMRARRRSALIKRRLERAKLNPLFKI